MPFVRRAGYWVFVLAGAAVLFASRGYYRPVAGVVWVVATVVTLGVALWGLPAGVTALLGRVCAALERRPGWGAGILAVAGCGFVWGLAEYQGRPLFPRFHDEFAYLLQTRLLSEGHIALDHVPMPEFFDSTYVLTKPVYATQYFLGASVVFVPLMWLGLAPWLMGLTVAGLALFFVIRWAIAAAGAGAGLWVAVLLPASQVFRLQATSVQAQMPMLLAVGLTLWLGQHGRKGAWGTVALAGAVGWACLVRPLDGLCLAVAMVVGRAEKGGRRWVAPLLGMVAALGVQIGVNQTVLGTPWTTPFGRYAETHMPGFSLGDSPTNHLAPAEALAQQRDTWVYLKGLVRPSWAEKVVEEIGLPLWVGGTVWPVAGLAVAGLPLAWRRRELRPAAVLAGVWVVGYWFYPIFLPHYGLVLMPVVAVACFAAWQRIGGRLKIGLAAGVVVLLVGTAVGGGPDDFARDDSIGALNWQLAGQLKAGERAVVICSYGPGAETGAANFLQEPVYNIETANPWGGRVVRVQDLGPAANARLLDYLLQSDPDREIFRFDRRTHELNRLGAARTLNALESPKP